ncbi:MAG: metallophosphoesterase [Sandaracinaceae bacterium]|nr:metallophosphoesterase [Sandaracinaceae bacterium]
MRRTSSANLAVLATLVLTGVGARASAQSMRRPYVQRTTSTEATIVWRDAMPSLDGVCVGASPDALDRHVGDATMGTDHAVVVDGLTPRSTWFYSVREPTCPPPHPAMPGDSFTTAPAPGDPVPFRIWVVGDSGTGDAAQARVRDAAWAASRDRPFDMFVHVGDMAYLSGTTSQFDDNFFAPYAELLRHTPVFPAIGNHEGISSDSASQTGPYYEAYVVPTDGRAGGLPSGTEAYYAYDWGDVHFVVLDSFESSRSPTGPMLSWLDADLASTTATWIVAFFHHPPYSHGTHDSDGEAELVQMRENALPILEAHGVDLVLAGHSHIYERSYLLHGAYDTPTTAAGIVDHGDGRSDGDGPYRSGAEGALYVVAGHGGASLGGGAMHPVMYFAEIAHGSSIIDVDGSTLTLRNIRDDGVETDHVTLVKGDGLFVSEPVAGSTHRPGAPLDIAWFHTGDPIARVDLEVSFDLGAHWIDIVRGLPDTGRYTWDAPPFTLPHVRVRVRDSDRPAVDGVSGDFALSAMGELPVVPLGSVWQYHDTDTAPPAGWATGAGDGWSEGPAQLGYGDGDEATTILDADPNVPSDYFRRSFTLAGARVRGASVSGIYDDAIAIFVNGRLVHSVNIADPADHAAYATGSDGDNAMLPRTNIPADAFVDGENWIAAVVKQDSAGSSDVSFDLELDLDLEYPPPPPADAAMPDAASFREDAGPSPDAPDLDEIDAAGSISLDGGAGGETGGGCGCRAARPTRAPTAALASLLVLALLLTRRRTRGR